MKLRLFILSVLFILSFSMCFSQAKDFKTQRFKLSMIHANYAYQIPGGNLKDLFGNNSSIGGGYTFKTQQNWLLGLDFSFMFGQNVNEDATLFHMLETHNEFIISVDGSVSEVRTHERGFNAFVKVGKLFPVLSPNPNSGFFVDAGLGFLTYKIRIDNVKGMAQPLTDEYPKGYDRLSAGFAFKETVGYMFLSNSRMLNFFVCVDFMQSFSHRLRDYDFDMMQYTDKTTKMDYLYSFRVGWIFNLYRRTTPDYYYN